VVEVRRTVAALAVLGALFGWVLVAPAATAAPTPVPTPASASTDAGIHALITVGMRVCIASRTGYRCGYVTALNQTICYPQGCLYGIVRTSIVPQVGDNGAYVYDTSGTYLGVVIGGSGGSTYFDPV
jgi:hypothetical protein